MNYLVTGAAGFIGAAIAERLINEGNSVTTIDNLSTGYAEHIPGGVEFIEGSTSDEVIVNKLYDRKFDAIIHIAGQSSGEISFEKPVYDLQTNAQSTLLLLQLARKTGCKQFVYASSMAVYGDHQPPVCAESTPLVPKSFYAVGKIASENYMRIFSNEFGLNCTALRFFNVFGVGQNMKNLKQGMASIYLAMALKDHDVVVKGSKDRFRDFVYIDDVVDAVLMAAKRQGGYDVFNVCSGHPTKVYEIIDIIKQNLPYEVTVEYVDGTPGDQFGIYGVGTKIYEAFGWKPKYTFEEGMKKMIEWGESLNL